MIWKPRIHVFCSDQRAPLLSFENTANFLTHDILCGLDVRGFRPEVG